MYCRKSILIAPFFSLSCLVFSAPAKDHPRLALQSTPTLEVFVYSFSGLSPWLVQAAESEATRILRSVPIRLDWIDCAPLPGTPPCSSPQLPTDLIIRLRPKAFPQASATALGMADVSSDYGAAFLFYDRILALRTERRLLFAMFGRVLAHEITHLLLPDEGHSDLGLMRAWWRTDDLDVTSTARFGLSARSVQLIHREALRRARAKEEVVGK